MPRRRKAIAGGKILHHVLQNAQLRRIAILEEDFLASIVIEISQCKRPAIFDEIETHRAGDIGECSIAIVGVENIALVTAPGAIGANQFVDRIPSLLVVVRGLGLCRATSRPPAARKNCSDLSR